MRRQRRGAGLDADQQHRDRQPGGSRRRPSSATGTLDVIGSTISGNTARPLGPAARRVRGGGIVVNGRHDHADQHDDQRQRSDRLARHRRAAAIYVVRRALVTAERHDRRQQRDPGRRHLPRRAGTVVDDQHVLGPEHPGSLRRRAVHERQHASYADSCGFAAPEPAARRAGEQRRPDRHARARRRPARRSTPARAARRPTSAASRAWARATSARSSTGRRTLTVDQAASSTTTAGSRAAADFNVHVRSGGADVGGQPAAGHRDGRTYTLAPGAYAVGEDADKLYTASFSGDCSATGAVTVAEGESKTCVDHEHRQDAPEGQDQRRAHGRDGQGQDRQEVPGAPGGRAAEVRDDRRHAQGPDHADRGAGRQEGGVL